MAAWNVCQNMCALWRRTVVAVQLVVQLVVLVLTQNVDHKVCQQVNLFMRNLSGVTIKVRENVCQSMRAPTCSRMVVAWVLEVLVKLLMTVLMLTS